MKHPFLQPMEPNLGAHMAQARATHRSLLPRLLRWRRVRAAQSTRPERRGSMARIYLIVLGAFLTAAAWSQTGLGTKKDIALPQTQSMNPASGVSLMAVVQMVVAVAIVLAVLKFLLPKVAPMITKRMTTSATSTLKVEETATFAGGTLYIVRARSKTLLLACSGQGVSCLADLTEGKTNTKEAPAFFEILDQETAKTAPKAAVHMPGNDREKIQEALARLTRLTG